MSIDTLEVRLWEIPVGALYWNTSRGVAEFNFYTEFLPLSLNIAPFVAPLNNNIVTGISAEPFHGLPSFIADSLPDKFGNALIDTWFAKQGKNKQSLTPLDRLSYIGSRAMGALTFHPATNGSMHDEAALQLSSLVKQARKALKGNLEHTAEESINQLLSVGISAGGARAKAVIAYNEKTGEIQSGQFDAPDGFSHWLLKFDGVGKDLALGMSAKYGRIEYAYYLMAQQAGITMVRCELLEENGRAHFLTQRFDRIGNKRLHMQSLCAISELNYNLAGVHSYEQYFSIVQSLVNDSKALEQAVKRAYFNIVARNQDDHTKNLAFLMDDKGTWSLAPAFDITYAYNPDNQWTHSHQMSLGGETNPNARETLVNAVSDYISPKKANKLLDEVCQAVKQWSSFAEKAGLSPSESKTIAKHHRCHF